MVIINSDRVVELVQQLPCDARVFDVIDTGVWLNVHGVSVASIYIRLADGQAFRTRRSSRRFRDFDDKKEVIAAINARLRAARGGRENALSFDDYAKTLALLV